MKFETLDLYLASFLTLHKQQPQIKITNGKVSFCFHVDEKLYELINLFNSDAPIPVSTFSNIVKIMRGKMLSAKKGGEL